MILASELYKMDGCHIAIDIGTNGEIVLSKGGELLCCSCAAGPALEGMNISCGMRAAEGAIEDIKITENGIELKVIGGQEPIVYRPHACPIKTPGEGEKLFPERPHGVQFLHFTTQACIRLGIGILMVESDTGASGH